MNIKLWSWHEPELFSLTEGRVDWGQSAYFNDETIPKVKQAYAELKRLLGTDQVIWCLTNDVHHDYKGAPKVGWVLSVPEEKIFRILDTYAWEKLLGTKSYPHSLKQKWEEELPDHVKQGSKEYEDRIQQKLDLYLSNETRQEILDRLFIETPYAKAMKEYESITVLLKHPIPESWVLQTAYRNIRYP